MPPTFISGGVKTPADPVPELGFDATQASAPWAMVSTDRQKTRTVVLTNDTGLTLRLGSGSKPGIVSFQERPRTAAGRPIVLTGTLPGTVRLEAQDSTGAAQATLEITVKAPKKLSTFVHFVFDKSRRATKRGLTEAMEVIRVANAILAQANVIMVKRDSGGVDLPFDLDQGVPTREQPTLPAGWIETGRTWPKCISKERPGAQGCVPPAAQGSLSGNDFRKIRNNNILSNILSHVDASSDYNIFFIDKLNDPTAKVPVIAFTLSNDSGVILNSCFCPSGATGFDLAHEIGHFLLNGFTFLDQTGHTRGSHDLMRDAPNDIKIPKQQANFMNPSGFP
jgi:hypothetical protein